MDNQRFFDWMRNLYGAFGKNAPQAHVVTAAYNRVGNLPDGFFSFASEKLQDREVLPQNLGRELFSVLWPEYLTAHPELRSLADKCPECDGKGAIVVRLATDRPGRGKDMAFPCVCQKGHDEGWTWERIHEAGYQIEQPAPQMEEKARQALARLGVRLGEIPDDRADQRRDRTVAVW
jgi:hypothetical protein